MAEAAELAPLEAFERFASLGPDFLTWLLVHILEDDLPRPTIEPALQVDVQGPLLFEAELNEAKKITLSGDEAATAPELMSALRQGKRLTKGKFLFTAVEDTWTFSLDGNAFDLRGIKIPVPVIPDRDEYISMRVQSTLHLFQMIDELFEIFLMLRLDPDQWREELGNWRKLSKRIAES